LRGITVWTRLHGLVSIELGGGFTSMGLDPAAVFEAEVTTLLG
jgi:hypothetical protein